MFPKPPDVNERPDTDDGPDEPQKGAFHGDEPLGAHVAAQDQEKPGNNDRDQKAPDGGRPVTAYQTVPAALSWPTEYMKRKKSVQTATNV